MRTLLIIFLFTSQFVQVVQAQHYFSETHFELQEISQVNHDVVELNIVNRSEQDIYLLRVEALPGISIRYNSKKLNAGEAILLRIKLNPKKNGPLSEKILVHLSSNMEPIPIEFKAQVLNVPKDGRQSCPDFSSNDIALKTQAAFNREKKGEVNQFFVAIYSLDQVPEEETIVELNEEVTIANEDNSFNESIDSDSTVVSIEEDSVKEQVSLFERLFGQEKTDSLEAFDDQLLNENAPPNNIVFLIDASSSMEDEGKMALLKATMNDLLSILRAKDYLSIVSYAGDAQVLLAPSSGTNKAKIKTIIDSIKVGGSTQAVKGIEKAIEIGKSAYIEGGNNQIFLATDGAFDLGNKNLRTRKKIEENAENGLKISVLAIKNASSTRPSLKEIVKLGKGIYIRVKSIHQIDKVSKTIKKQVKEIQ